MSVNMLRLHVTSDCQPRSKKGHPARKDELEPVRRAARNEAIKAGEMAPHFEQQNRQGEAEPDPEPAGHVDELRVRSRVQADQDRFERHAADRA